MTQGHNYFKGHNYLTGHGHSRGQQPLAMPRPAYNAAPTQMAITISGHFDRSATAPPFVICELGARYGGILVDSVKVRVDVD